MDSRKHDICLLNFLNNSLEEYFSEVLIEHYHNNSEYKNIIKNCEESEMEILNILSQIDSPVKKHLDNIANKAVADWQILYFKGVLDTIDMLKKCRII